MTAKEWCRRADQYVQWCLEMGTPPRAGELASQLGLSPWVLSRRFSAATGERVGRYLRAQALEILAKHVRTMDAPLDVTRKGIGFCARSTFLRVFREALGMTPGEFRAGQ